MDAAAAASSYPDSVGSSPRSRGGESWDDLFPSSAVPAKLRFMCSYGGQIVPRPHDKSLCYLGGETRIVAVDRHSTLADLSAKLSRSLLGGRSFSLKYQLPSEDLDSLISVTTDEDLDNMLEEYDRILASSSSSHGSGSNNSGAGASGKPARLRLFLFPLKLESPAGSIGSLIDDSKAETWFVDALNSAIGVGGVLPRGLSSDSVASSVNCLLGLEEERNPLSSAAAAAAAGNAGPPDEQVQQERPHNHQIQMPRADSAVKFDTSSSFGSTSSAPSPSNLPPNRVRTDDRIIDQILGGGEGLLEDSFSQMNISDKKQERGFTNGDYSAQYQQQHPPPPNNLFPLSTAAVSAASVPPTENPNNSRRVFSDDEKPDFGRINRMAMAQPQQQLQQLQQQRPNTYDAPVSERPAYYKEENSPGAPNSSPSSDVKQEAQYLSSNSSYGVQVQVSEQGFMLPIQPEPLHPQKQQEQQQQLQLQQHQQEQQQQLQQLQQQQLLQRQQLHHHQQQQLQQQQQLPYVHHHNSHLVHHPNSVPVAPASAYYQMHHPIPTQQQFPQAHPYNQQLPMYYVQVRPNTPYVLPVQQQNLVDISPFPPSTKPTLPIPHLPPQGVAPLKPEQVTTTNVYSTNAAAPTALAQPLPSPQLIHLPDQSHQFMGYHHTMHHQASKPPAAPSHDGYEQQPMYYTHVTSAPLPAQYQTMSSVAVAIPDVHQPQLQQADGKQNRAS